MSDMSKLAQSVLGTEGDLPMPTLKLDDIVKRHKGVVTIVGLTYTTYEDKEIPVFIAAEDDGFKFWGGCKKLTELAENLVNFYGDLKTANRELHREGVRIKIGEQIRTKSGKPFRPVVFLETVRFDDTHEPYEIEAPF